MIELRIIAAARHEFDEAIDWYAAENMPQADRFEAAVDEEAKSICRRPLRNPKWGKTRRFTLVLGFPYYIDYRAVQNRVEIVAIFHTSCDVSDWTDR